ncbi:MULTISPECIES: DMT family transporter [unclassified Francisella]|uniref:DMT family transporter n=1 Tax=unclassified Francisella TaxID=2610885 RepID=UPI002E302B37|nr:MULTISPECIES: DMT family transporter [unclassified Francisella]MED7819641.1 DMT family transporter [Francisella sp. 19S2-4]MED7830461.1 DMT family transporter [Francisella sp. 19S2-10]
MIRNYVLLLGIGVIWGSQFIFQQVAVQDIPPVWIGFARSFIGFMTLFVICKYLRLRGGRNWFIFGVIGFLEATVPFVLIPWGQQYVDSSITAILIATVAFFATILSPVILKESNINFFKILSVIIGFAGLVILFFPDLFSVKKAFNLWGVLAIILAAASFACSLLCIKKFGGSLHPVVLARNVLAMSSIQLFIVGLFICPKIHAQPTLPSVSAVVFLGVMCAGVVYFLFMKLIHDAGPIFASLTNYLVPAVGVFIGTIIAHEYISINTWVALATIFIALAVNQISPRKLKL